MNRTTRTRTGVAVLATVLVLTACGSDDSEQRAQSTDTATGPVATSDATPAPTGGDRPTDSREAVPAGAEGIPRGLGLDISEVDRSDPDAVTDAVLTIMHTHDTDIDLSPSDAPRRAVQLLTPEYAATTNQTIPGGGGADWTTLAQAGGYTTVTLEDITEYDAPQDTDTEAYRERIVTVTSHTPLTALPDPQQYLTWVTLTRPSAEDPWAIASVDIDIV